MSEKSLREFVKQDSIKNIQKNILKIDANYKRLIQFCSGSQNIERTNKNVALTNIAKGTHRSLSLLAKNLSDDYDITLVALCTRNLFELNIRLRSIIKHENSLNTWMSEMVMDENQILDAISTIANDNHADELELFENKKKLNNSILDKHNLKSVKSPETVKNIAKDAGDLEEYTALFKLFSKLLHPSSYLINSYNSAGCIDNFNILIVSAQKYAFDLFERLRSELNVPEGVLKEW
ncbi:DUF5677 domain-containing protein [Escherichia coli]|uniref:DUF5677 domain-containing protein n=1 Tax=Escherichia coli TaxID=562 RepID=UPI0010C4E3B0|nr:DUF5677 domain-containing protein [Escherichia coli]EFB3384887.1 hypothetical protein [Escherichia coli]EIP9486769.1 hypothetical protein [Escherichia coli]ELM8782380.1 hypothetical protein [Escherichia coli]MBB7290315.1 hypothetical protein [Escherichia coli]GCS05111.1 hypothetical protein BvCmsHHNP015_02624 [Escherichia coli]